ncbi:hypothetical protein BHU72_14180 [Desulfuribacillus stibiiarsenatis]|uniref:DUF2889 domain-containing protein n=1 Tax=Desulfuribacillus stibiiarsenatis TaxID=1390249 RepID=A0A1E5L898_9FIRM|nr:DUF2889 domain-containing protein [Desulfuribacillus stibiiarsenatis]OEH86365.1 hypothetical protein BHU72_14180 [Desulfuribacillus stibiiarsenatis]
MFIFTRQKFSTVEMLDSNTLKAVTAMNDTRHEMIMEVFITYPEMTIQDIKAQMLRKPEKECEPALGNLQKIIGLTIGEGLTKSIREKIGDQNGCTHLTDMLLESAKAAIQAQFTLKYQHLSEEHRKQEVQKVLKDNCVLFAEQKI